MVNFLTDRAHRTTNGTCPYCGEFIGLNFTEIQAIRNGRMLRQHSSCNNYYAMDVIKNIIFPIQDPQDPNSSPYV